MASSAPASSPVPSPTSTLSSLTSAATTLTFSSFLAVGSISSASPTSLALWTPIPIPSSGSSFISLAMNSSVTYSNSSSIYSSSISTTFHPSPTSLVTMTSSSQAAHTFSIASEATSTMLAKAAPQSPNSLSTGAKAGIALAVILFLAVVACVGAFLVIKRRQQPKEQRAAKRGSVILGNGRDGVSVDMVAEMGELGISGVGLETKETSGGGSIRAGAGGVWRTVIKDDLEKVGRYEDAQKGLPLPRTDGDIAREREARGERVRTMRMSAFGAWRGRGVVEE